MFSYDIGYIINLNKHYEKVNNESYYHYMKIYKNYQTNKILNYLNYN